MDGRECEVTPMDREATELKLEHAALALLQRDGILAGVNLREVADEAGVTRGLVYHYFGSRQELLRAALRRDTRKRLASIMALQTGDLAARIASRYRAVVEHRGAIRLLVLLALDGDARVRLVYAKGTTVPELADGMQRGEVPCGISPEALQVAVNALAFGYALLRERYASETGIPSQQLDDEIELAFYRLVFARPERIATETSVVGRRSDSSA